MTHTRHRPIPPSTPAVSQNDPVESSDERPPTEEAIYDSWAEALRTAFAYVVASLGMLAAGLLIGLLLIRAAGLLLGRS